ncbi:MAG: hypothetical protein KatS3mg121_0274 [Gammaproteobacteria bacterium]|nr:MAG: hypothetical protein KatS3mg121_0274 [Gammaproteobacteria bacterium]
MARVSRRSRRIRHKEMPELNITSFLNLMVVLVPFLLITAVFSRITILQLNLPEGASAAGAERPELNLEVIVRADRIELGDGREIVAVLPVLEDGGYDLERLRALLLEIKYNYPEKQDAMLLMEADLPYRVLVEVMDTVSTAVVDDPETGAKRTIDLFPQISIGDAPGEGGGAA